MRTRCSDFAEPDISHCPRATRQPRSSTYLKLENILHRVKLLLVSASEALSATLLLEVQGMVLFQLVRCYVPTIASQMSLQCGTYLSENSSKVSSSWPPLLLTAPALKGDLIARDWEVHARAEARVRGRAQGRRKENEVCRAARRRKVADAILWQGFWSSQQAIWTLLVVQSRSKEVSPLHPLAVERGIRML